MEYREAVAEARTLVKRSEEDQWRLADLTWEQVEAGSSRRQWARDVGIANSWAQTLYKLGARWHGQPLAARPNFGEASLETHSPERAEETTKLGSRYAAEAAQTVRNMPPEQKAEVVREALAEPEVAERIVRDTPTRTHLAKAEHAVDRERQETAKERYELTEPRSVQIGARADLGYALTKARTALEDAREAADKLAAYGWPEGTREEAQVLGQRVHAALELYWATVRGEELDDELRALVEGGDA